MKTIKILLITLSFMFLVSCGKTEYKQPLVGMKYQDFIDLCGQPTGRVESKQDKNVSSLIVKMEHSEEADKKQCYGTLTFENGKLAKIDR